MTKGLLARTALFVLGCTGVSFAAPLSLGMLTLNEIGTPAGVPDDYVLFRMTNWNGYSFGEFSTPVSFKNVTLDITWANGIAPPNINGPLNWYRDDDPLHLNPLQPRDLPPRVSSYESSWFQKKYGITKGVLTMELDPPSGWSVNGGGTYTPPASTYELVFFLDGQSDPTDEDGSLPSWDLQVPGDIPEPSTYSLGAIGAVALLIKSRRQRSA
jgi:hypothetical protein